MPKETGEKLIVQNKKARHDYAIEDKYEAGLALTGTEVKSLREGRASLSEAFISIDRRGEMRLEGANIPEYLNGTWNNHAPTRKAQFIKGGILSFLCHLEAGEDASSPAASRPRDTRLCR